MSIEIDGEQVETLLKQAAAADLCSNCHLLGLFKSKYDDVCVDEKDLYTVKHAVLDRCEQLKSSLLRTKGVLSRMQLLQVYWTMVKVGGEYEHEDDEIKEEIFGELDYHSTVLYRALMDNEVVSESVVSEVSDVVKQCKSKADDDEFVSKLNGLLSMIERYEVIQRCI